MCQCCDGDDYGVTVGDILLSIYLLSTDEFVGVGMMMVTVLPWATYCYRHSCRLTGVSVLGW